jgi:hypothetical protein
MPNSNGDSTRGTQRREELVRRHLSAESVLPSGEREKERRGEEQKKARNRGNSAWKSIHVSAIGEVFARGNFAERRRRRRKSDESREAFRLP